MPAEFIEGFLAPHIERPAAEVIAFLGILGNDDLRALDERFEAACARVQGAHPIAGRKIALDGYEFLGLDLVPDCPFRLKDRCRRDREGFLLPPQMGRALFSTPEGFREVMDWPEEVGRLPTIEEELARLPSPDDPARAIYVIHTPPSGIGLDLCGGGRGGRGRPVGSRAVHEFLRRVQPRMSLHGHIHESPTSARSGRRRWPDRLHPARLARGARGRPHRPPNAWGGAETLDLTPSAAGRRLPADEDLPELPVDPPAPVVEPASTSVARPECFTMNSGRSFPHSVTTSEPRGSIGF